MSNEILVVNGLHEDEILHSYMGITINHYKDPYSTTSIMESKKICFSWLTCFHLYIRYPKGNNKKMKGVADGGFLVTSVTLLDQLIGSHRSCPAIDTLIEILMSQPVRVDSPNR